MSSFTNSSQRQSGKKSYVPAWCQRECRSNPLLRSGCVAELCFPQSSIYLPQRGSFFRVVKLQNFTSSHGIAPTLAEMVSKERRRFGLLILSRRLTAANQLLKFGLVT
jgi:hypothetical protein